MALQYWVDFFSELEMVRGRSKNTIMAYRRDLELYDEFLIKSSDPSEFYAFLKSKNLSSRSQARVISSLRTYLRFCERQGESAPELRVLRPPRVKACLPQPIGVTDFERLFAACEVEDTFRTARNHITLLLLFGIGCRVSELIGLDLHDYNDTGGWIKILGKGGKERLVPLTTRLHRDLKDYLTMVRSHLIHDEQTSILINDRGRRPSRVDIWRWLAAWSARAGLSEPVSPHQFRHGCATALLEGGADLRSIQMPLGHSSIQSTQIYTSVSTKELAEEVAKHHPLSEI